MSSLNVDAFERLKRLAINNYVLTHPCVHTKPEEELVQEWRNTYEKEFDIMFDDMRGA